MDRFPGQLVLDEKKASHLVFGCKRSVFQSLVAPMIKGVRRFGISGAMAGASLGAEAYSTVGDSWVQGGLFMLKDGQVVYAKPEKYPGDFPVAEEWAAAMRGVGASDELAAGQDAINYEVALNEWLEARKAKKKSGRGAEGEQPGYGGAPCERDTQRGAHALLRSFHGAPGGGVLARCAGGGLAAQTDGTETNGGVNEGRKRGKLSRAEAKSGAPAGWAPVPRRSLVAAVVEMTWRGSTAMYRSASADRATEEPQRHFGRGGAFKRVEGGRAGPSWSWAA
mmetsp:Transcript_30430/g.62141  ORF Transcript_30430/g.62141 Transcript_30430/m.62141 type:complete len:280 (-) Transcript_30430:241-1080(-)